MTVYTYAQLEQLWINNGGPAAVAPVAAAVALAESSGDSQAENKTDNGGTQTSWGLWQISDGTHNQPVANILDPNVNAQQAVAKWRAEGNSFSPDWGTYDSGAYTAYLSPGTTPDPNVPSPSSSSSSAAGGDACAWKLGLGPVSGCVLSKVAVRDLAAAGLMLVSGVVGLAAVAVLAAFAFRASGAARAAGAAARVVPGVGRVAGLAARAAR